MGAYNVVVSGSFQIPYYHDTLILVSVLNRLGFHPLDFIIISFARFYVVHPPFFLSTRALDSRVLLAGRHQPRRRWEH